MPLGNVYYYLKTKDDIARAVVEDRTGRFLTLTEEWEQSPDPISRLLSFLEMPKTICQSIARHGCPVGSLSQELSKKVGLAGMAQPLKSQLDWVTQQFRLLCPNSAETSGRQFIVSLQGASLLANSLNDPDILLDQIEQLSSWIQSFSS